MSNFVADRVQEHGTCSGTGNITITGSPPSGYRTFSGAGITNGQTCTVLIMDESTYAWEISKCTYNSAAGGSFARTTFKSASSGSTFVNFASGTKTIACVPAASDVVTSDVGLNYAARIAVASAATCDIGAAAGNWLSITGTTTITSLGTPSAGGYWRWLEFAGALTLTNNSAIVIYGGASVTTQAGMMALAMYDAVNTCWRVWILPSVAATAAQIKTGTDNFTYLTPKGLADVTAFATLTDAATVAWDGKSDGPNVKVTLGGNRTFGAPTNLIDGRTYVLRIAQDGTGSRTGSFNSAFDFGNAGAPTLSTSASKVDYVIGVYDSTAAKLACNFKKSA